MSPRIVIVPRWGGTEQSDWYPWLRAELSDHEIEVAPLAPEPGEPAIAPCIASLAAVVGDAEARRETMLVGHSVGCQAVVRYLASLGEEAGNAARCVVCVAGWFWVDDPWPSIRPWIDEPIDWATARRAAGPVRLLMSDDDPFTADHRANADAWSERLGAEVELSPGSRHFNEASEPRVLTMIRAALAETAG